MSQCDQILAHLKREGSITPLEALRLYQSLRLAARVEELRAQGHAIQTQMIERKGKRFAKYVYQAQHKAA